jgi:hypothetical protein
VADAGDLLGVVDGDLDAASDGVAFDDVLGVAGGTVAPRRRRQKACSG